MRGSIAAQRLMHEVGADAGIRNIVTTYSKIVTVTSNYSIFSSDKPFFY